MIIKKWEILELSYRLIVCVSNSFHSNLNETCHICFLCRCALHLFHEARPRVFRVIEVLVHQYRESLCLNFFNCLKVI